MKTILVTGGTGYIGSHTVVELMNAGYNPVLIDDFSNSTPEFISRLETLCGKPIQFREGSCCDKPFLETVFQEFKIDSVIHFAAFKAVGESVENPGKYYHNNITGLLNIIDVMEAFDVKQLIFSSSCTVYGEPEESSVVFENSDLGKPNSPYGWTKWMNEQIIRDYVLKGNIQAVMLRYFNPIGAHSSGLIGEQPIGKPNNIVPFITQTAIGLRDELVVFGNDYDTEDGTCMRDYVHVSDIAKAHISALTYGGQENPAIFNLGTGNGTSVLELIHLFEEISNMKLNWSFGPRRSGDIPEIYANTDKAKKELHWQTSLTVKDALIDSWRWEQNRNQYESNSL
jgi:UDP-glucose 4-epimerase